MGRGRGSGPFLTWLIKEASPRTRHVGRAWASNWGDRAQQQQHRHSSDLHVFWKLPVGQCDCRTRERAAAVLRRYQEMYQMVYVLSAILCDICYFPHFAKQNIQHCEQKYEITRPLLRLFKDLTAGGPGQRHWCPRDSASSQEQHRRHPPPCVAGRAAGRRTAWYGEPRVQAKLAWHYCHPAG